MKIIGKVEAIFQDRVYVTLLIDKDGAAERYEAESELKHFDWKVKEGDEFILEDKKLIKLDPKPIPFKRFAEIIKEVECLKDFP